MSQSRIQIDREAEAVLRKVQQVDAQMDVRIAAAMDRQNQFTIGHIQRDYLSFPKQGPTQPIGCRTVTNRLRGSIRASATAVRNGQIETAIGSNVSYAAAQEFGFEGDVTVRPYTRRGRPQATRIGGKLVTVQAQIAVRGFTRHMNLPGRAFIRTGIADRMDAYRGAVSKAIVDSWRNAN